MTLQDVKRMTDTDIPADLRSALADAPVIDRDGLLGHTGGSPALASELARMFVARHASIAAPLRAAIDRGDTAAIAVAAHGARGAVAIIGASRAVLVCTAIEAATDLAACSALVALLDHELGQAAAALAD
jgi:HPt (histidine-containing phosphotransfer) domain-containing protein